MRKAVGSGGAAVVKEADVEAAPVHKDKAARSASTSRGVGTTLPRRARVNQPIFCIFPLHALLELGTFFLYTRAPIIALALV